MGIFDLNEDAIVIREPFMGSNLYYIDDFYKHPDDIAELFNKIPTYKHSGLKHPNFESLNGVYFNDRRISMKTDEITKVWDYLSSICNQKPNIAYASGLYVLTNQHNFTDKGFNNYKDNYWHPHKDTGYTSLVYLNKHDDVCGTNLYKSVKPDLPATRGEHVDPWRSKENWEIITTLKPKFNRCVLFDGLKFIHGMHIPDDRYFGKNYRLNQVFFFQEET